MTAVAAPVEYRQVPAARRTTAHLRVSGKLVKGDGYTSQVRIAVRDDSLARLLAQHHVQVKAPTASGSTPLPIVLNLLPFALFLAFFIWLGGRPGRDRDRAAGRTRMVRDFGMSKQLGADGFSSDGPNYPGGPEPAAAGPTPRPRSGGGRGGFPTPARGRGTGIGAPGIASS